jgi:hypothetical protein
MLSHAHEDQKRRLRTWQPILQARQPGEKFKAIRKSAEIATEKLRA